MIKFVSAILFTFAVGCASTNSLTNAKQDSTDTRKVASQASTEVIQACNEVGFQTKEALEQCQKSDDTYYSLIRDCGRYLKGDIKISSCIATGADNNKIALCAQTRYGASNDSIFECIQKCVVPKLPYAQMGKCMRGEQ